jgi:hypothetical protein
MIYPSFYSPFSSETNINTDYFLLNFRLDGYGLNLDLPGEIDYEV